LIERSTSRREPAVQTSPWLKAMALAADRHLRQQLLYPPASDDEEP